MLENNTNGENLLLYANIFIAVCCSTILIHNTAKNITSPDNTLLILILLNCVIVCYAFWEKDAQLLEITHMPILFLVTLCIVFGKTLPLVWAAVFLTAFAIFTRGYYQDCLFSISRGEEDTLIPDIGEPWIADVFFIVLYTIGLVRIANIKLSRNKIKPI